jgi:hypothetical protein
MYVFVAQCAYADFELSQLKDDIELGDIALTIERFINILTEDPYHVFEPEYDQHDLDRDYAGFTALRVSPARRFVYRVLSVNGFKRLAPSKFYKRMVKNGLPVHDPDALVLWIHDTAIDYHLMGPNSARHLIQDSNED